MKLLLDLNWHHNTHENKGNRQELNIAKRQTSGGCVYRTVKVIVPSDCPPNLSLFLSLSLSTCPFFSDKAFSPHNPQSPLLGPLSTYHSSFSLSLTLSRQITLTSPRRSFQISFILHSPQLTLFILCLASPASPIPLMLTSFLYIRCLSFLYALPP